MPAGMNCKLNILGLVTTDDEVGGAYSTGTVLHGFVDARIDEDLPRTDFIQQGLETVKTFSGMIWGHDLTFREQQEGEIVSPPNHEYFGKKFRIVSKVSSSNHPMQKRNVWIVKLVRSQVSHKEQYQ
jgi:hypothetical protein